MPITLTSVPGGLPPRCTWPSVPLPLLSDGRQYQSAPAEIEDQQVQAAGTDELRCVDSLARPVSGADHHR